MTVGSSTYKGLGVPLNGEIEFKQDTAATDFITLTGDSSISGDFLVCRTGSTEMFVINSSGRAFAEGGLGLAAGKYLKFSAPLTTAPITTGLVRGQMFLCLASGTPQLGVAINSGTTVTSVRYFTANTATFGRASTT
jgi:hypothetical protein